MVQGSGSIQLALVMALAGGWIGGWVFPAQASSEPKPTAEQREGDRASITPAPERPEAGKTTPQPITQIPRISDQPQPATTVKDWLAQIEAATMQVTAVKLERTDTGLDIILETAEGKPLQVDATKFRSEGNSLIADIPNAVLALPEGQAFTSDKPSQEIASIQVVQQDVSSIRVIVTGTNAVPQQEVTLRAGAFAYVLNPKADEPDEEIVVTGEGQRGYRIPNASTATRIDTPLRDTPVAVQVIPQRLLRDQQVITVDQALPNVSSVVPGGFDTNTEARYAIRGFDRAPILIDGFRQYGFAEVPEVAGLERLEVLKGPSSILYGEIQPGGLINAITKKPTATPFYEGEFQVGSFGLIRPRIDLSGLLTEDGTLSYRLNALYLRSGSYRGYSQQTERLFIAPVLSWKLGDHTTLSFHVQSQYRETPQENGTVAIGGTVANLPRDRVLNEPDDYIRRWFFTAGYNLDHNFSDDWKLQNTFRYSSSTFFSDRLTIPLALNEATGQLNRLFATDDFVARDYGLQTTISGKFTTGTIAHALLFGVDYNHNDTNTFFRFNGFNPASFAPINIFNPTYGAFSRGNQAALGLDRRTRSDRYGIFLQDQIAFTDNLKLLAGLRYETVNGTTTNGVAAFTPTGIDFTQQSSAITPRVGIVYQPTKEVSLYTSYSQSFNPSSNAFDATGTPLGAERGEGYEVGVKTDVFDGKLSATLAYYDLIRSNVATANPAIPGVSVATGEQRSNGLELDVVGELAPGWNVIASYAYTNARVTRDNVIPSGNRLPGIPQHSANLWTTYQLQSGELQGLGFGIGFTWVGDRTGDLANSFDLDSYFLTNAAIFYRRDNWNVALNMRNLFNTNYTSGIPFSRVLAGTPGEPFTITASLSIRF